MFPPITVQPGLEPVSCKRFQESCFRAASAVKASAHTLRRSGDIRRHSMFNIEERQLGKPGFDPLVF